MTTPQPAFSNRFVWLGLAGVMVFFSPLWNPNHTLYFRDLHIYFFPMKAFLAKCLQNGELALWCSHYFCGAPFASDIQSGVFYPPSLILAVLPFPYAVNIFVLLHAAAGFVFCFVLVRSRGCSDQAALIAGLSFVLGGFGVSSVNTLNNLCTIVWLPAVLWAFGLSCARRWALPLTAVFLCLAILGGEPQLWLIIAATLACSAVITADSTLEKGRRLWQALKAMALALALAAVQLGPTALDWLHSVRRQGFSFDQAADFSLAPAMLVHLFFPLVFPPDFSASVHVLQDFYPSGPGLPWLLTIYPGLVILPLALAGACLRERRSMVWLVAAGLGLVLALGQHMPVFALFYRVAPFFRYPEKFMALTHFALVVAAAHGLDRLSGCFSREIAATRIATILAVFLFADLTLAHYHLNPVCDAGFYRRIDSGFKPLAGRQDSGRIYTDPQTGSQAMSIDDTHRAWQATLAPNLGVFHKLSHVDGRTGMELNYQWLITEMVAGDWPRRLAFLRLAGVGHIISTQALDRMPQIGPRIDHVGPNLFRIPDCLPRAYLSGMVIPADASALEKMVDPDYNPRSATFGPAHLAGRLQRPFFQPVDAVFNESNSKITIETHAPQPCLLVFTEAFYPGWRVWVDGKPAPLVAANLLFQGVALEPGHHRVTFAFRPLYLEIFALISVLALGVTAWWLWRARSGSAHLGATGKDSTTLPL